jgi:hypothetical protein
MPMKKKAKKAKGPSRRVAKPARKLAKPAKRVAKPARKVAKPKKVAKKAAPKKSAKKGVKKAAKKQPRDRATALAHARSRVKKTRPMPKFKARRNGSDDRQRRIDQQIIAAYAAASRELAEWVAAARRASETGQIQPTT